MSATLIVKFTPQKLSLQDAYAFSEAVVEGLGSLEPEPRNWWSLPRGPKAPFVAFTERSRIIAQMEADDPEFVGLDLGPPSVQLTNAGDEKAWRAHGRVGVAIDPSLGRIRLSISDLEKAFERPSDGMWSILHGLSGTPDVRLVQTNVRQTVGAERLLYSIHRAPFPHREFLGWMGYVDAPLTQEQVPAAARLERRGGGTLILATEVLDLADAHAVKQANQVEMSLVDLGLLPVTDPLLG